MKKEILISLEVNEKRVAILEDGKLEEFLQFDHCDHLITRPLPLCLPHRGNRLMVKFLA